MHPSSAIVTAVEAVRAFMVGYSSIWIDRNVRRVDRTSTRRGGAKLLQSGDTDRSAKRFHRPATETDGPSMLPNQIKRRALPRPCLPTRHVCRQNLKPGESPRR